MAQIFDPLPTNSADRIVCCYVNATSKMQIARITNIPNWYFERVVFPGQRLLFESMSSAQLEIHCGMMASAILSDTIPCERLRVDDDADILNEVEEGDEPSSSDESASAIVQPMRAIVNSQIQGSFDKQRTLALSIQI